MATTAPTADLAIRGRRHRRRLHPCRARLEHLRLRLRRPHLARARRGAPAEDLPKSKAGRPSARGDAAEAALDARRQRWSHRRTAVLNAAASHGALGTRTRGLQSTAESTNAPADVVTASPHNEAVSRCSWKNGACCGCADGCPNGSTRGLAAPPPPPPPPPPPHPPPPSPPFPPPPPGATFLRRLNQQFVEGGPSPSLRGCGVLLHQVDAMDVGRVSVGSPAGANPTPWLPCPRREGVWCAKYGDRISASVVNQRVPFSYSDTAPGFVVSPGARVLCSYPNDGGTMSKTCASAPSAAPWTRTDCVPG